jgi:antitoxin HicB
VIQIQYAVIIQPLSNENGGEILATVPDLPGCMSNGQTPEEALRHVHNAIEAWIKAAHDMRSAVPQPSRKLALAE